MRCPFCKVDNDRVVDSRSSQEGGVVRRRRECLACNRRFTTYERVEETPLKVIKKNGSREPFDREKILTGVRRAIEKRPVSEDDIEKLVRGVEEEIGSRYEREIPSQHIGEMVMQRLKALDTVAYVRFASVYKEFKDPEEFMQALAGVQRPQG
jgi:transcriptional repressor NrdR